MSNFNKAMEAVSKARVIVVGSGLTGAVLANQLSNSYNVVVIEKREHVAGNVYTELDEETNIHVHKYGAHIFHTSQKWVWDFVNQFGKFNNYRHHVLADYGGNLFSLPFSLKTYSEIYGVRVTPQNFDKIVGPSITEMTDPKNLKEKAISTIGKHAYRILVEDYTKKQWGVDPEKLPASVIGRLPVRRNYDTRYFNDEFEGIPVNGYTHMVEGMLEGIPVFTGVDWFDVRDHVRDDQFVIYTGEIDKFFDYKHGKLTWRSVRFEHERHKEQDHQGIAVMNYTGLDKNYTRIIEHKHFNPDRDTKGTIVSKEYSCAPGNGIDPYYPVNLAEDKLKLALYKTEEEKIKDNVYIGGRLGKYAYFDMAPAISLAFRDLNNEIWEKVEKLQKKAQS
ncbi:UDP-galactopyranose mutase [Agrobacterium phage Atu_ph04]|uniref:UDP-galactopyranose mutase n=1 Tax=Agrobacterium phage Atu_ph04 TaxID=2024263 RepID=A0A223VZK3_9CAUD|nr:UDP-galactopyranose mutase [Agrobacterium phage Atu_ph04]ASV44590.1 UDP-galactopyranose mutase [Agrobacterium phage Atu_ph04]